MVSWFHLQILPALTCVDTWQMIAELKKTNSILVQTLCYNTEYYKRVPSDCPRILQFRQFVACVAQHRILTSTERLSGILQLQQVRCMCSSTPNTIKRVPSDFPNYNSFTVYVAKSHVALCPVALSAVKCDVTCWSRVGKTKRLEAWKRGWNNAKAGWQVQTRLEQVYGNVRMWTSAKLGYFRAA